MPDRDITEAQQRYLFSSGSPLTKRKKRKLADEMRGGKVRLRARIRRGHGIGGRRRRGLRRRGKKRH